MSLPSDYEAIADRLEIRLCKANCWQGKGPDYSIEQHRIGFTQLGTVHWMRRGVTRRGLYRFLKLAVEAQLGIGGTPAVWRTWAEATEAYELGLQLGVRFEREIMADDRARVRALLAKGEIALDKETYERITRWSRE